MKSIVLQNKSVFLSECEPAQVHAFPLVGREMECRHVLAAWQGDRPLAPILISPPGMGKNRIIAECARLTGLPLYILQGHEDLGPDDLVTSVRFSDDPTLKMDYVLSRLATAMIEGGICFFDEIGKVRARCLAPLASVLDDRRYLDSTLLGTRIYAHPNFKFVAATNNADIDAEMLPDFIRSRLFPVIRLSQMDFEQTNSILSERFNINETHLALETFWSVWSSRKKRLPLSARIAIQIFLTALGLLKQRGKEGLDNLEASDFEQAIKLTWEA